MHLGVPLRDPDSEFTSNHAHPNSLCARSHPHLPGCRSSIPALQIHRGKRPIECPRKLSDDDGDLRGEGSRMEALRRSNIRLRINHPPFRKGDGIDHVRQEMGSGSTERDIGIGQGGEGADDQGDDDVAACGV